MTANGADSGLEAAIVHTEEEMRCNITHHRKRGLEKQRARETEEERRKSAFNFPSPTNTITAPQRI